MLSLLIICIVSSFILIGSNELFYFFNFTSFTFSSLKIIDNYWLDILIIVVIIILIEITITCLLICFKLKVKKLRDYFIISLIKFMILCFILIELKLFKIEFQSLISLLFSVILTTYQFFYSIFYSNVVK